MESSVINAFNRVQIYRYYKNHPRVKRDVVELLQFKPTPFHENNFRLDFKNSIHNYPIVVLFGSIPVSVAGCYYFFPLYIEIPLLYPEEPPSLFVWPVPETMFLDTSHPNILPSSGFVQFPNPWMPHMTLTCRVQDAMNIFSIRPPLYSKPQPNTQWTPTHYQPITNPPPHPHTPVPSTPQTPPSSPLSPPSNTPRRSPEAQEVLRHLHRLIHTDLTTLHTTLTSSTPPHAVTPSPMHAILQLRREADSLTRRIADIRALRTAPQPALYQSCLAALQALGSPQSAPPSLPDPAGLRARLSDHLADLVHTARTVSLISRQSPDSPSTLPDSPAEFVRLLRSGCVRLDPTRILAPATPLDLQLLNCISLHSGIRDIIHLFERRWRQSCRVSQFGRDYFSLLRQYETYQFLLQSPIFGLSL